MAMNEHPRAIHATGYRALPVGESSERQKYAQNEPWLRRNRLGIKPLLRGTVGSVHIPKDRVTILTGYPHQTSQLPTVSGPPQNLPPYFSWIDNRSLFNPQCPRFPMPSGYNYCDKIAIPPLPNGITTFVLPPINQSLCGNCYAVSSANATAARFAIWGLQPPVRLSYYQLTDCSSLMDKVNEAGCGGGNPADCFSYMKRYGVLSEKEYQSKMAKSGQYPAGPNGEWPEGQASFDQTSYNNPPNPTAPVPTPDVCIPQHPQTYPYQTSGLISSEGDANKAVQFTTIESIKLELFNNGPVVGMYKCWDDFIYPSMYDMHLWPETNNIYVRGAYKVRSKYTVQDFIKTYNIILNVNFSPEDITTFQQSFWAQTHSQSEPFDPDQFNDWWKSYWAHADTTMEMQPKSDTDTDVVGHAIMIVGWGIDHNVPGYGTLEYWIVQNSWGDNWNDNGYFKIAMSQQKDKQGNYKPIPDPIRKGFTINQGIGIDLMTDNDYGGVFAWKPRIIDPATKNLLDKPKTPVDAHGHPIPLVASADPCLPLSPSSPPSSPSSPPAPLTPPAPSAPPSPPAPSLPTLDFPSLPFFDGTLPTISSSPSSPPLTPSSPPIPPSLAPSSPSTPPPQLTMPILETSNSQRLVPLSPSPASNTCPPYSFWNELGPLGVAGISIFLFVALGLLVGMVYITWKRNSMMTSSSLLLQPQLLAPLQPQSLSPLQPLTSPQSLSPLQPLSSPQRLPSPPTLGITPSFPQPPIQ